ncbi:MAG TPA: SDR family oxidoreductase [Polyangiaceae bacterium LLY-WYZ-15_(1-7)]|nr:3-oxoacyl-ACP reductase [Myxococcales bacterium]MAT29249.1 3-oxoacyl-ACP reductase [Sandaracinus sp.]HJK94149.1 SDR family oxidoreductase [Polyangiaceae bacterium LLY-WYZ-15_(1-7)]MBJ74460.1 3-oxoacyl-ACP reductase [Sandaracinus sp.]HJL01255.1 SDR family oxidoreductase [Polyangiaceae bacterium LLY-WYZ-15_(1-7)]
MKLGLEGKVVVVTGGTRGIGRAIAEAFAAEGAKVVVSSRSAGACAAAAEALGGVGVPCDVTKPEQVDALFEAVAREGGCDVFVANAGVSSSTFASELSREEMQRLLDVHYLGAVQGAQRAAEQMRGKGGGAILLVTSIWGFGAAAGTLAYGAAKAALAHAVKGLAVEWARDGIRVNGLAPGFVATDMTAELDERVKAKLVGRVPLRREAQASEMAGPAVFLCSDAASYVTGHVLFADGGERAR